LRVPDGYEHAYEAEPEFIEEVVAGALVRGVEVIPLHGACADPMRAVGGLGAYIRYGGAEEKTAAGASAPGGGQPAVEPGGVEGGQVDFGLALRHQVGDEGGGGGPQRHAQHRVARGDVEVGDGGRSPDGGQAVGQHGPHADPRDDFVAIGPVGQVKAGALADARDALFVQVRVDARKLHGAGQAQGAVVGRQRDPAFHQVHAAAQFQLGVADGQAVAFARLHRQFEAGPGG